MTDYDRDDALGAARGLAIGVLLGFTCYALAFLGWVVWKAVAR
jgi:hypothetical protein